MESKVESTSKLSGFIWLPTLRWLKLWGVFNSEQSNQFYKLFSSMQNFGQFSPNISSVFLAYKGNYLNALFTISWYKISWIINYGAFDHMINVHHLFSTYSSYVGSFKVRVSDGSFLIVVGRWSIQISKFNTQICPLCPKSIM